MAQALRINQRTYAHYEQKLDARIPIEVLQELAGLGLNLHWLFTATGEMIRGSGVNPLLKNASKPEPAKPPSPRIDTETLVGAAHLIDEIVFEGKAADENVRWGWMRLIAELISEMKALGREDGEVRERLQRWIATAKLTFGEKT